MRPRSPLRLVATILASVLVAGALGVPVAAQDVASPVLTLPGESELAADAALTPPTTAELVDTSAIDLGAIQTDLETAIGGLRPDDWTIPDLAAVMAYDPALPFAFVRDRIAFQPYAGVLRGADGTLAARAGNSWDRALLLQALLDEMLIPTRLAWGALDAATAAGLVARGLEAPGSPLTAADMPLATGLDLVAIASRARRDHAVLRQTLGDRVATLTGDETAQAARELGRHAWVQALIGTEWVDLDPTLPTGEAGHVLTTAIASGALAPDDQRHAVEVRVVAEHLDEATGQLTESTVLEHRIDVPATLDEIVTLAFTPESDQLGGTIATLFSGVASWQPVLGIAEQQIEGRPFSAGGSGTDLFGEAVTAPQLTALRLELTSTVPDRDPVSASTLLLDRVLPADRIAGTVTKESLLPMAGDATGAAAMSRVTHLMLSAGGLNVRDHLAELGYGFAYATQVLLDPELAEQQQLSDLLRPLMAIDDNLPAASELLSVPALRDPGRIGAFVAAPRVFLSTFGPDDQPHRLMLRIDLVLDGVRILAGPSVAAADVTARRIWYGALQSAIETEIVRDRAVAENPADVTLSGASYATGGALDILDAAAIAGRTDLPPALVEGVAAGGLALVPAGAAAVETWWAVEPDGFTRAMLAPTFGGNNGGYRPGGAPYKGVSDRRPVPRGQSRGPGGVYDLSKPPKGARSVPVGNTCRGGDSTGYIAVLSCVSIPGALVFRIVLATAIDAVIFAVIWGAFKAVEASAGN